MPPCGTGRKGGCAVPVITRWWWIRHAPVTTYDGRVYGQTDVAGDTSDAAAFAALAAGLPAGARWVTSQLRRTHDTAEAVARAGLRFEPPLVEPALAEQHFGDWQGRDRRQVIAENSRWPGFWLAPADVAAPGGESFLDLVRRVVPAIERLSAELAGGDIVAVAHGGTIKAALGLALGLAPADALAFATDNLSLTRIDHLLDSDGRVAWQVDAVNVPPGQISKG